MQGGVACLPYGLPGQAIRAAHHTKTRWARNDETGNQRLTVKRWLPTESASNQQASQQPQSRVAEVMPPMS